MIDNTASLRKGWRYTAGMAVVLYCGVAPAAADTTAWNGKAFVVDTRNVVGRSDIVLARPPLRDEQALPLGNGQLGVSVSGKAGFTAQLNRADTMPYRNSPGQIDIPGLSVLNNAADYRGRLDLYNGTFTESGGGLTATAYVQPNSDTLIVDVSGADPSVTQTVYLYLWNSRAPTMAVYNPNSTAAVQSSSSAGAIAVMAESWVDSSSRDPEAENKTFGSLAAISVVGRNVRTVVTSPQVITITFTPNADGTFRVITGAPHFDPGSPVQPQALKSVTADLSPLSHTQWWNDFWNHTALIRLTSSDGTGEYMENLRNINLFTAAAERGDSIPGSQAGVGDLFSSVLDSHQWDPAAYWHWNLRAQVAANLSSGHPELNNAYFNLYRSNVPALIRYTTKQMKGAPGICVPETMRFNGAGDEFESWGYAYNCSLIQGPWWNARTLSTGAEVSHWVWQQYLVTRDLNFLTNNYPIMQQSAVFLSSYQQSGAGGLYHTSPSNAHETQWDVNDPTTDIAAVRTLYPETVQAAHLLNTDYPLVVKLTTILQHMPDFPRTQASGNLTLLDASSDAQGNNVIADSYQPAAPNHNSENVGLEPVWPYDVIGDQSPMWALARRTYASRPYPVTNDWNFDPIQAARLQLPDEVKSTLVSLTKSYQKFTNGLASLWGASTGEFYVEQSATVAATLAEALVQDYDGIIRIAPAVPVSWDFDGSVLVRDNTKVDVQTRQGKPTLAVIEPGLTGKLRVMNPWPSSYVTATTVNGQSFQLAGALLNLPVTLNVPVVLTPTGSSLPSFSPISGIPATAARTLGPVSIGLMK